MRSGLFYCAQAYSCALRLSLVCIGLIQGKTNLSAGDADVLQAGLLTRDEDLRHPGAQVHLPCLGAHVQIRVCDAFFSP